VPKFIKLSPNPVDVHHMSMKQWPLSKIMLTAICPPPSGLFPSAKLQNKTTFATKRKNIQRGASMLEYALLVAMLSLIAIAALKGIGRGVGDSFNTAKYEVDEAFQGQGDFIPCPEDDIDCSN